MIDRTKNSIKPFWSWNDKLEKAELVHQIEQMKNNGIEGFFMHAGALFSLDIPRACIRFIVIGRFIDKNKPMHFCIGLF